MADNNHTPQVVVCYAHQDNDSLNRDQRWLDRLLEHLGPLEVQQDLSIWSDQEIEAGSNWQQDIQATLKTVKAAVLLVSPSFLNSSYIRNSELPVLLQRAKEQDVLILPLILRTCLLDKVMFKFPDPQLGPETLSLASLQGVNTVNEPLNGLSKPEQDKVLVSVAQRLLKLVSKKSMEKVRMQAEGSAHLELEELDRIIWDTFQIDGTNVDAPILVRIPAGKYLFGSEEEETRSQVINEFAIGQFPVTFCQYDLFCELSGHEKPNDMGWGRDNRPVINVSFFDAMNYIKWLCKQTGKEYRLPTVVEWEYAARSGTNSVYWWGNEITRNGKSMANCNGCGEPWGKARRTSPVDDFPPNDWMLYDMAGNVWEWTQTIHTNSYKRDDIAESEVHLDKLSRVIIKGGSWYDQPEWLHWSTRVPFWACDNSNSIGFRVAQSLPRLA
ncbi:MAG: SUMF1/EgtB/PvdO family nonheme iron enzyme [Leptolyngbya sp. SIO4C1]|nr:SUMF1/EgtB/PvdO family nonheme iron enzyme [Leptolyngbya sp. SIO4C1]